jgi:23S rRNA (uridine2479-2'-O)-methyltransferase
VAESMRVTRRNARYQQWQALLTSRNKRQRAGEFVVQGVRPITLAVEHGWRLRALIYDSDRQPSAWAAAIMAEAGGDRVAMAPDLIAELGGKDADPPELLAIAELPADELSRIPVGPAFLGVALDRPASPGNIGTIIRSADAFGADGVVIAGHAADPYDPQAVRASTGSLFARPVVRAASHGPLLAWVEAARAGGVPLTVVGTDEDGSADITEVELAGPVLLVIGTEATGLSAGWRESCDLIARIPITGAASSLNAASAASVALYEAARQRRLRLR